MTRRKHREAKGRARRTEPPRLEHVVLFRRAPHWQTAVLPDRDAAELLAGALSRTGHEVKRQTRVVKGQA